MKGFSGRVISSFLWSGGSQIITQAISWAGTLVVLRALTATDYGLLSLALVFMGFFFLFADLGFGAAVIQARELDAREPGELLSGVLAVNVIGAVAFAVLAPRIATFFSEPRLVLIIRVLSVNFAIAAAGSLSGSLLLRDLEFRAKSRVDIVATIAGTVVAVSLARTGSGVWALVFGTMTQNVIRTAGYQMLRPVVPRARIRLEKLTPLMRFGLILSVDRALYYWGGQADVAIGGRVLGTTQIGYYTMAMMFASVPLDKVLPTITSVSFVAFSRIQEDIARVKRNVIRALSVVSLGSFPVFWGLVVVAPDAVPVLIGDQWAPAIAPLRLLCLIMPFRALASVLPPALFGIGKPQVTLLSVFLTTALNVIAFLIGVRFGVIGLAAAWVVVTPVTYAISMLFVPQALTLSAREAIAPLVFPALASFAMLVVVLGLRMLIVDVMPVAVRLATLIAVGAGVYAAVNWFWNRESFEKLWFAMRPSGARS